MKDLEKRGAIVYITSIDMRPEHVAFLCSSSASELTTFSPKIENLPCPAAKRAGMHVIR